MLIHDRVTGSIHILLKTLVVGNVLAGLLFGAALIVTWPAAPLIGARLSAKYGAGLDIAAVIAGLRALMLVGVICAVAVYAIFRALVAVLETVRAGGPFAAANAARLRTVG